MDKDSGLRLERVLVDGAMTGNALMMQTLADFLSEFSSPTNAGHKFDASISLAITCLICTTGWLWWSWTWVRLTMILVIPWSARFCLRRWEFGRIVWATV